MRRLLEFLAAVFMTGATTLVHAQNLQESDRFAGHEKLVAETHAASLKLREASLRGTIARKDGWIFASNGKAFAAVRFLDFAGEP